MPLFSTRLQLGVFLRPGRSVSGWAGLGGLEGRSCSFCVVAEQRAAGHRTLDTGTLDGIRRYDGDPGAGPGPGTEHPCLML